MVIIRDLSYSLPSQLPIEWAAIPQVQHLLLSTEEHIIWMAEYNFACINAMKKRIGIPDSLKELAKQQPQFFQQAEQGILDTTILGNIYLDSRTIPLDSCCKGIQFCKKNIWCY